MYRFEVFPIVQKEQDARSNKKADYSVYKIYSKKTYIMVEVKLGVSAKLISHDKDDLAQLFLESIYCCNSEKGEDEILCILTDGFVWHCIVTDLKRLPLSFKKYIKITLTDDCSSGFEKVCKTLTNYVLTKK